ncbi:MAG: hypothetical protein Q9187_004059, partial [Circinaria calcarea]
KAASARGLYTLASSAAHNIFSDRSMDRERQASDIDCRSITAVGRENRGGLFDAVAGKNLGRAAGGS